MLAFWIGVYPAPFFAVLEEPVDRLVRQIEGNYEFPAASPGQAHAVRPPAVDPVPAAAGAVFARSD